MRAARDAGVMGPSWTVLGPCLALFWTKFGYSFLGLVHLVDQYNTNNIEFNFPSKNKSKY